MTIKEVEKLTGLSRSNVRFYEKEKLIVPVRNERNGYRDYSNSDIENLKKIAYLRTLGISIEDIRSIISENVSLREVIQKQNKILRGQISELNRAKKLCEKMLDEETQPLENKIENTEVMQTHFESMLRYMGEQESFLKMMNETSEIYKEAAEYIEENGMLIYGYSGIAKKEELLKMNEWSEIYAIEVSELR